MRIFNKQKRIQSLGFNDLWFTIIGILLLATTTNYLFNNPEQRSSFDLVFIGWFSSLFVTICDWLINRSILIYLRKKLPDFKDDLKRMVLLFFSIVAVIVLVDFFAGFLISTMLTLIGYISTDQVQLRAIIPVMIITIMVMAIYEAVFYYRRLKTSVRKEEQAKQVMIQAKLDTLRNQSKPHFLFNSFNTLRDIIDEESKEDAKEFVDKLSDCVSIYFRIG